MAVDDLHCETIARFARAALRIDGDAPVSIKGCRRHDTLLRARVKSAPPVPPLLLGAILGTSLRTSGSGGLAGFARRAELTATLIDGGGRLRQCLGCRERSHRDKYAQYCPHISTP